MNTFNYDLYNRLLIEDRNLINEYTTRMSGIELNSFMERLIEYYKTADAIEINEDADAIVVFERHKIAKSKVITGKDVIKYLNKYFIRTTKNISKLCLLIAINKYFDELLDVYSWKLDLRAKNKIRKIYLNLIPKYYVQNIQNVELSAKLYICRIMKSGAHKKCLGIALDGHVLAKNNLLSGGFGRNFKLDIHGITYNNIDITSAVKKCSYWTPQNAITCGFDTRTGIIWFDGKLKDGTWELSNDTIVNDGDMMVLNASYTTDAFEKMFYRLKIENKIAKIIFDLNNGTIQ
jgi:hypothetical protein